MVLAVIGSALVIGVVGAVVLSRATGEGDEKGNVVSVAELKKACENFVEQDPGAGGTSFAVCQNSDEVLVFASVT